VRARLTTDHDVRARSLGPSAPTADTPCRAGSLATGFAVSRPAIFKHTRLLARAGLIKVRKRGRERIYALAPRGGAAIRELVGQHEEVGRFWDTALGAFKPYLEEKE
jgi:DNA-binding transcriptional ArsR family regulator